MRKELLKSNRTIENNMTNEEKELLLKDLCARLPYGVKASSQTSHLEINTIDGYFVDGDGSKMFHLSEPDFWQTVDCFQYYLRPMSSMIDEEREEFRKVGGVMSYSPQHDTWAISAFAPEAYDWLNAYQFDYRGLIEMGLALEAKEDMYK